MGISNDRQPNMVKIFSFWSIGMGLAFTHLLGAAAYACIIPLGYYPNNKPYNILEYRMEYRSVIED